LLVEGPGGSARITEVESITGDVIANCRKGKLIFFYEVVIKLKWSGECDDGTKVNGTATIPNLSEEQDIEDIEVQVKLVSDESAARKKVKELVRKKGSDLIRVQLGKWLKALKEEYALDLVKPTKGASKSGEAPAPAPIKTSSAPAASNSTPGKSSSGGEVPKYVDFSLSEEFSCSAMDLFQAIVDQGRVQAYTQSACKIDPKVGGEFTLFSGNVQGVFEKIEPGKMVQQAWRFKHWPAGHFSTVVLKITEEDGKCKLSLSQKNVPEADLESTKAGWRSHQWDRMKAILGLGGAPRMF